MQNIGDKLNNEEIEEMLNEADQDHDGHISYDGKSYVEAFTWWTLQKE